jgi:hypothetical protein
MKKTIAAASIRVLAFVPVAQDVATPSGADATADADEDRVAETRTVPFADTADSVAAGDFDGEGHADVVVASRGRELTFLPGKGGGKFGSAERLPLPGAVTALTYGEVHCADGLADLTSESPEDPSRGGPNGTEAVNG